VRTRGGHQQRAVGQVHEHRHVRDGIVGQLAAHAHPVALARLVGARGILEVVGVAQAHLDRAAVDCLAPMADGARALRLPVFETVGRRRFGHLVLVREPGLGAREARREVEDRLAVLIGDDVARRERLAVADPLDDEPDRQVVATSAQEVGVQRVERAVFADRAIGGHH
jgi:hypothetical protein